MTDPLNGLRFDIYERVHLPDDVAAIEELEEIELVPHMQANNQGDQVLLKGHLLLSGIYRAKEQERGVSKLEHWIPVEISLPPNRVPRVEDLAVEIDNFDVDLLSTRSLNVTGVLALRGLQAEQQQVPVWRDDSFTVVHQAPAEEDLALDGEEEWRLEQREEPADEPVVEFESSPPFEQIPSANLAAPPQTLPYYTVPEGRDAGVWPPYVSPLKPEPAAETAQIESQPSIPAVEWKSDVGWGDLSVRKPEPDPALPEYPAPWAEKPEDAPVAKLEDKPEARFEDWPESKFEEKQDARLEDKPEDKPELKVALGAKSWDTPVRAPSGVGLLSILGDKGAAREAELQALRAAQAEADEADSKASRMSTGDELEWTKLFLSKGTETQQFSKVRMCIVQREDTLDSIAARYNVQTRELQLRNRLSDPYLSEGQVLYIP